jgi:phosphoribosylaminoimidazole-succinocarboxamide synthase
MKNKQKNELAVCGFAAVKTLEKNNPQKIKRLYFSPEKAPLFGGLCKKLASKKIPYNQVEENELEKICASVHHQGVVAMIDYPKIQSISKDEISEWKKNKEHAILLDIVQSEQDLATLRHLGRQINSVLQPFFATKGLKLVDFKVEFGIDKDGNILLADEISPDSCRFWDANTGEKMDKDRFRQDLGNVKVAYEEVLRRILS